MSRVLVVGSVAMDEVVALRQPLERDRHLEGSVRARRLGGGAANTAIPLAHAGHAVAVLSVVGTDADGDAILAELDAAGVDTAPVVRLAGPSTRSLVLVEPDGERTVVNLHRCREADPPRRLLDLPADVIYVRSREAELAPLLSARLASALVVAHVPPAEPGARPAHVLVASAADLGEGDRRDPWATGRRVAGGALRAFVLTLGAEGAEAYDGRPARRAPARRVTALDATGAGDVFAAGLVHALSAGAPLDAAVATAVAWGTAAVETPGLPPRARIRRLLAPDDCW